MHLLCDCMVREDEDVLEEARLRCRQVREPPAHCSSACAMSWKVSRSRSAIGRYARLYIASSFAACVYDDVDWAVDGRCGNIRRRLAPGVVFLCRWPPEHHVARSLMCVMSYFVSLRSLCSSPGRRRSYGNGTGVHSWGDDSAVQIQRCKMSLTGRKRLTVRNKFK